LAFSLISWTAYLVYWTMRPLTPKNTRSIPQSCSTPASIPTCIISRARWAKPTGTLCWHALCSLASTPPVLPETESDIDQLKERIASAKDFVASIQPAQIDGTEEKEVIFTFRNGTTRQFTGRSLLLTFSVPQFFFHLTTAYDILRHCGVELAKKDFLAARRA
jgi:Domain of unknown function (DUF1993)